MSKFWTREEILNWVANVIYTGPPQMTAPPTSTVAHVGGTTVAYHRLISSSSSSSLVDDVQSFQLTSTPSGAADQKSSQPVDVTESQVSLLFVAFRMKYDFCW